MCRITNTLPPRYAEAELNVLPTRYAEVELPAPVAVKRGALCGFRLQAPIFKNLSEIIAHACPSMRAADEPEYSSSTGAEHISYNKEEDAPAAQRSATRFGTSTSANSLPGVTACGQPAQHAQGYQGMPSMPGGTSCRFRAASKLSLFPLRRTPSASGALRKR